MYGCVPKSANNRIKDLLYWHEFNRYVMVTLQLSRCRRELDLRHFLPKLYMELTVPANVCDIKRLAGLAARYKKVKSGQILIYHCII